MGEWKDLLFAWICDHAWQHDSSLIQPRAAKDTAIPSAIPPHSSKTKTGHASAPHHSSRTQSAPVAADTLSNKLAAESSPETSVPTPSRDPPAAPDPPTPGSAEKPPLQADSISIGSENNRQPLQQTA